MKRHFLLTLLFAFALPALLLAQQPQVFTGAKIIPINDEPIDNGVMVIQDGKIQAIGAQGEVDIPSNAKEHDVSGKVIMPGLVDSHSHIGSGDGGDRSSALHPDVRILDSIDPRSDTFKKALAGGITTVNVMPGSGHLMSGQTVYLKLRNANTIEDMLFVDDPSEEIAGGLKMANGTNPIGDGPFPGTRAKSASMVRELFIKAQNYKEKIEAADGGMSRDAALKALTIENAKMMDLQNRVGTLEEGKDADFVVLSNDPLSTYTRVQQTWVEGNKRFDINNPEDRKYATGGYNVFERATQNHHHGRK